MPADLETRDDGTALMAYAADRGTPWHKLGTALAGLTTGPEILAAAGLAGWDVALAPMFVLGNGDTPAAKVPDWSAVQRGTDGAILGTVRSTYKPLQNEQLVDFIDAIVDDAGAKYDTAGSLSGGRTVWVQAEIPSHIRIAGDDSPIKTSILGYTGHDGRRAMTIATVVERVVCRNTLEAAVRGARQSISIRHTTNADARVGEARKVLGVSFQYLERFEAIAKALTQVKITKGDVEAFTEKLLPLPEDPDKAATAVRTKKAQASIAALFERSNTMVGMPRNGWRLYNAVTEHVDHEALYMTTRKNTADENRAYSLLDGNGKALKAEALRLLVPAIA